MFRRLFGSRVGLLPMAANNLCLIMTFGWMIHRVVAGNGLPNFAMMPRSLTGHHVRLCVRGSVAGNVLAANVADGYFLGGVNRHLLVPCCPIFDPNPLRFLDPVL